MTFIKSVVSKALDVFEEFFSENFSVAGVLAAFNKLNPFFEHFLSNFL